MTCFFSPLINLFSIITSKSQLGVCKVSSVNNYDIITVKLKVWGIKFYLSFIFLNKTFKSHIINYKWEVAKVQSNGKKKKADICSLKFSTDCFMLNIEVLIFIISYKLHILHIHTHTCLIHTHKWRFSILKKSHSQ